MKSTLLFFLVIISCSLKAQQKLSISGSVKDSTGLPLSYTSILLLAPADSALVSYTLTDEKGNYNFKNVDRTPLLLKATYVSYLPVQVLLDMPESGNLEVDAITLIPISKELYEVVVKTAKAPMSMRGDTIEYDAGKFKVPPGATLEDLMRKLPGVQIDKDGNIIAQGQQVQKVTVDGRRFFGNNTKMATQNLNADAVSKVQIFDDKSEAAKLTGVQDGIKEKTVNVELKEEAKKGGFGKITAAAGTDNRWTSNGLFNKFDKVNQFSIVGYGNNTNQSGLSWDDYQEFKGGGSYNGFGDDGDFGFDGSGGMYYIYFSGGDNEDSFNVPFNDLSSGFSNNQGAGINYNYLKNKKDFNSSYFFSRSDQVRNSFSDRTNFLQNNDFYQTTDNNGQNNLAGHHRLNFRFQNEMDSSNTITLVGKGRYSNLSTSLNSIQELIRSSSEQSEMTLNNGSDKWSGAMQGIAIYRHKFKKKGRNFAVSVSNTGNKGDLEGTQKATVDLLNSTDPNSYFRNLDQLNSSLSNSNLLKSSLIFIEPIKKVYFLETFYNFSQNKSQINRQVYDVKSDTENTLNINLSRFFDNQIYYNRVGSSIRYSNKGSNLSLGLAAVNYGLRGQFAVQKNGVKLGDLSKNYFGMTPNFSFWKSMKGNKMVNASYGKGVAPPSMTDLQPYKDISNPLYIREGNPDLLPQISHTLNMGFSKYDPVTFINLHIDMRGTFYESQIVQNQTIDTETLVTTFKSGNIKGGSNYSSYVNFGFPIIKTKISASLWGNPSYQKNFTLINDIKTLTTTFSHNYGVRLDLTPLEWLSLYSGTNLSLSKTKYAQNANQNQNILNWSVYSNMNLKLPKEFYLDANFNYNRYENKRFGFDQKLPILNAFAYKLIGKQKKVELRLSAYDIFKRKQTINQNAGQNYVYRGQTQTLSRYFLLGITYNMRGVEIKNRR